MIGVFRDDVLSVVPLAPVLGLLGWPIREVSVQVGSVLVVPSD
jgi:hypothetical protein